MNLNQIIGGFVSSGVLVYATWFLTRRKYKADVNKIELENIQTTLKIYKELLDVMKAEFNPLIKKLEHSNKERGALKRALEKLNLEYDALLKDYNRLVEEKHRLEKVISAR